MKTCSKCKVEKPFSCFHKRSARASGYSSHCKDCRSLQEKERYLREKDSIIEKRRDYNEKNRSFINTRQREYNAKNKEKIKAYSQANRDRINANRKVWRNENPANLIADRFRRRLNYALKTLGIKKNRSSLEFLGCSLEFFKEHLEKQFLKGMNWENREEWHIDHIIPMATAKTEDDVVRLSHFTNLRPLWKRENFSKNKAVTHLI